VRRNAVGIAPCPLKMGATRADVLFHNRILDNFMVYRDRFEINLLQLFGHQYNSECSSIISAIIFEVNILVAQKLA